MHIDKRLLRWARRQPWLYLLAAGSGLAVGLATVWQARLVSQVVNRVFLSGEDLTQVMRLLVGILLVIGLRTGLGWVSHFSARKAGLNLKGELRRSLYSHLFSLGPAFIRGGNTGELTNTLTTGIEALEVYFGQYLLQVVLAALIPLTFLLFIFPLDPLSGLVLLLTAPLIPFFMVFIGSQSERLTQRQWGVLSKMSAFFLDLLQGLSTLKMLGRSQAQVSAIEKVNDSYRLATLKVMRVTFLSALTLELVATLSTAIVAVEVGLRLLYGRLAFEQAFFVLLLAPEFYLPLRSLGARFHAGLAGIAAAARIFGILEEELPSQPSPFASPFPAPGFRSSPPSLSFRNVSYSYSPGRPALRGVTFEIPAGQKTALVGPSGAGKTTLADLLLRFINPQQGEIWLDGQPHYAVGTADWRSRVAWVPQKPYLFYGTVEDNIRLGNRQAEHEQVIQAARLAHADEFIQALPQGYQTQLGERGSRLSGGQVQRIALARAFLKDASLIILDEATANLDPETDAYLQESFDWLVQGRTVLLIAHRLGTALRADHVVVLAEGQVIEQGSPQELLSQAGMFAGMVQETRGNPGVLGITAQNTRVAKHVREPATSSPLSLKEVGDGKTGSILLRLLGLLKPFWGRVALSVLLGTLTVLSAVGLMAASAYIISMAALSPSIAELQVAVVGVRFFGISRGLFRYLERLVSHEVSLRTLGLLRLQFYRLLEPLAPARLQRYRSGDLLQRIVGDIHHLEGFYVRAVAPGLVAILTALVVGWYLGRYSARLTLGLWLVMALAGIGLPLIMRLAGKRPGIEQIQSRAELNSSLVDGLQGMPDLLAFGADGLHKEETAVQAAALEAVQLRIHRFDAWQSTLTGMLSQLSLWLMLFLGIPLVAEGVVPGVLLASLALAALASFEAITPLPQAAQVLESDLEAGRRLFEIISAEPDVCEPVIPRPLPERLDLDVRSLSFAYPPGPDPGDLAINDRTWALSEVSFSLPFGKKLAVVGASGSGKSTLLSLLLRFWEYTQGELILADQELRQYSPQDWRSRIGVVTQNPYLFNASLRENLLIACPSASQSMLDEAAKKTQLLTWIMTLPEGWNTTVGEMGLQLSGGERQRAALARALLKDPGILFLDEPTANLDAQTERQVMQTILELMENRTVLLITHRLIGLEAMDEILVLGDGRVVECGTHLELLALGGTYCRMWELQQQGLGG